MATLQEQLTAARDARVKAEGRISKADADEIRIRDEIASERAAAEQADRDARELDLNRRLDAAEAKSPGTVFRKVMVKHFADTFLVQRDGKAHAKWEKIQADARRDSKKGDTRMAALDYAIDSVYDWNGKVIVEDPEQRHALRIFLQTNSAIVTPLTNVALEVNGLFAEETKS